MKCFSGYYRHNSKPPFPTYEMEAQLILLELDFDVYILDTGALEDLKDEVTQALYNRFQK